MKSKIKYNEYNQSILKKELLFSFYYNKLLQCGLSVFEWKNLPVEVDPIFIEWALLTSGQCLFFYDEDVKQYVVARFNGGGNLDIYNKPIERIAYSGGKIGNKYGFTWKLDNKNSVIIYNNTLRLPSYAAISIYANKLANYDVTVDININAQKTPIAVLCPENQKLTLKNLYMKYEGGSPVIFGDSKILNPESLKVINTGAPFTAKDVYDLKLKMWDEFLSLLGVSSNNTYKRERLITYESLQSTANATINKFNRLSVRQRACDEINAMFGLNVICETRTGLNMVDMIYNDMLLENEERSIDEDNEIVETNKDEKKGGLKFDE